MSIIFEERRVDHAKLERMVAHYRGVTFTQDEAWILINYLIACTPGGLPDLRRL